MAKARVLARAQPRRSPSACDLRTYLSPHLFLRLPPSLGEVNEPAPCAMDDVVVEEPGAALRAQPWGLGWVRYLGLCCMPGQGQSQVLSWLSPSLLLQDSQTVCPDSPVPRRK